MSEVDCDRAVLAEVCRRLFHELDFAFAGLIVEEHPETWGLRYVFSGGPTWGWVYVLVDAPIAENFFPSIVIESKILAADWHEREAEDLFGVRFEGHPRLGDFVLHDDAWQEGVEPMRRGFDAAAAMRNRLPDADWRPRRVVQESGRVRHADRAEVFRGDRIGPFPARDRGRRRHPLLDAAVLQVARDREARRRQGAR